MNLLSLKKVRDLQERGEHDAALSICDGLLADDPFNHEIARERVSVLEKMGRHTEAIDGLVKLAADSEEPADYFDLARMYIKKVEFAAAIEALDALLAISEREQFDYYTSSAKFLRAFALIETNQKQKARDDIRSLDGEMRFWIPGKGLMTVAQLKAAA